MISAGARSQSEPQFLYLEFRNLIYKEKEGKERKKK